MPSEIPTHVFHVPGVSVLHVISETCGLTGRYGPVCMAFDPHSAELKVCPYWYGVVVTEGSWHHGEARDLAAAAAWLATHQGDSARRYKVRCLAGQGGMIPGATTRG